MTVRFPKSLEHVSVRHSVKDPVGDCEAKGRKFYRYVDYDEEDIDLNLNRFKVENDNDFTILYYKKNKKLLNQKDW